VVEPAGVTVAIDTSGKSLDIVATELVALVIHNAMLELQNEVCDKTLMLLPAMK